MYTNNFSKCKIFISTIQYSAPQKTSFEPCPISIPYFLQESKHYSNYCIQYPNNLLAFLFVLSHNHVHNRLVCLFLELHFRVLYHIFFCIWIILFNMIFVRFIHVATYRHFIFITMWNSHIWIVHDRYIHSDVDRYSDCLQFGALTQIAAMNILIHIF